MISSSRPVAYVELTKVLRPQSLEVMKGLT